MPKTFEAFLCFICQWKMHMPILPRRSAQSLYTFFYLKTVQICFEKWLLNKFETIWRSNERFSSPHSSLSFQQTCFSADCPVNKQRQIKNWRAERQSLLLLWKQTGTEMRKGSVVVMEVCLCSHHALCVATTVITCVQGQCSSYLNCLVFVSHSSLVTLTCTVAHLHLGLCNAYKCCLLVCAWLFLWVFPCEPHLLFLFSKVKNKLWKK